VLTSTSGLGSYSLSVLTDPSIRLLSVQNKILPPAPGIQQKTNIAQAWESKIGSAEVH